MPKLNLIWVQLEAYGALNQEKNAVLNEALRQSDFSTINLTQTVCAAPSTVMTTMGLLTGVSPVMLAKDHIPKRFQVPDDWQASGFQTITNFLEEKNYEVIGINAVYDCPKCLPMFKDTHAGVTSYMGKKEGYNFWEAWCIPQRLRNIKESLSDKPKAFFFHLIDADILPELLNELATIGLDKSNTVMVLVGDHGWPIKFFKKEPALFHDLHQEENNIRVACHISFPGCKAAEYSQFTSALDLAPTALDLMGFDLEEALPKAEGLSLKDSLESNLPTPERILRLDNRYIAQRKNKVVTLVNSKFRYCFRYETDWAQQPYYKYELSEIPEAEELYFRTDLDEKDNLIDNPEYKKEIQIFRDNLSMTETKALKHFYGDNLFDHYLLREKIFKESQEVQRIHSSARIQKALIQILQRYLAESNISKIALYGAGNHTRSILSLDIINDLVSCILDDNPLVEEIEKIPVVKSGLHTNIDFKALVLSSDYFEFQLKEKAEGWLPKSKEIIPIYQKFGVQLPSYILNYSSPKFEEIIKYSLDTLNPETVLLLGDGKQSVAELEQIDTTKINSSNISFKKAQKHLLRKRFELIVFNHQSLVTFLGWLSQIDQLLEPSGVLIANVQKSNISDEILKDISEMTDDLKINFVKNGQSSVIVACLWRFNS
ncbi:MAG: sulfatase-like hydrolase/transferase [Lentisphaerales bacterium]|nr:sulfatase-like hydrolase/transferase [Lentisphaerales bacterium]